MTKPVFVWSDWANVFPANHEGYGDGHETSVCSIGEKAVGSVMRSGLSGTFTAFMPGHPHHSHIETEAKARGVVEFHAGSGIAPPLDPYEIVRALKKAPRASTEEEVGHLVNELLEEERRAGYLYKERERAPTSEWRLLNDHFPAPADTPVLIGRAGFKTQIASLPTHIPGACWPALESKDQPRRFEPPTHYAIVREPGDASPLNGGTTP